MMRPQRCNLYLMSCFALNMNQYMKYTKLNKIYIPLMYKKIFINVIP